MSHAATIFNTALEWFGIAFGVIWAWAMFQVFVLNGTDEHKGILNKMGRVLFNVSFYFLVMTGVIWLSFGAYYVVKTVYDEMPVWLYLAVLLGIYCYYYRLHHPNKKLD